MIAVHKGASQQAGLASRAERGIEVNQLSKRVAVVVAAAAAAAILQLQL